MQMTNSLDDVAEGRPQRNLEWALKKVGMENMACQVLLNNQLVPAQANAFVSLTAKEKRGIHMSRIFELVTGLYEQPLSREWVCKTLEKILESHDGISDRAYLDLRFDLMLMRKALISDKQGWRSYPVRMVAEKGKDFEKWSFEVRVLYSSTCPCSASLSRRAIQEQFAKDFSGKAASADAVHAWLGKESSIAGVPHAQRSEAIGRFQIGANQKCPEFSELIDKMEAALSTPVQTAVKREDEQEFARRNAANLMFCEDAARRLKAHFNDRKDIDDFNFEVRHFESLHPHDVMAQVYKHE
jgi:GTP cyclohydrolase IB